MLCLLHSYQLHTLSLYLDSSSFSVAYKIIAMEEEYLVTFSPTLLLFPIGLTHCFKFPNWCVFEKPGSIIIFLFPLKALLENPLTLSSTHTCSSASLSSCFSIWQLSFLLCFQGYSFYILMWIQLVFNEFCLNVDSKISEPMNTIYIALILEIMFTAEISALIKLHLLSWMSNWPWVVV